MRDDTRYQGIILTREQRLKALIRSRVRQLRHRRATVRRENPSEFGGQE